MAKFKVGIIGTGLRRRFPGATGAGMAHAHALGYETSPDTEIVAIADINPFAAEMFCEEHNVPRSYLSADEMLEKEKLDIVSVTVWPHLHAEMTIKAAEAGVKGIHCEKPVALNYGDAKKMVEACEANGVVLTFNHMRRFGAPFRKAKSLLKEGAIGELTRLEAFTDNLYDWGTHWFDMLFFYNDETPVEWVMGQIEPRRGRTIFGAMMEGQGLSFFQYANGVSGLMVTGDRDLVGDNGVVKSAGCANRLIGTAGTIEVGVKGGPDLRLRSEATGGAWEEVETGPEGLHGSHLHVAAIANLIDAVQTGREPELAARRALQTAELIFATYESSRRRGRVDLPLTVADSPFVSMLNLADITMWPDAYVDANGVRLHYWRTGDGTKPPLVLCHGYSDNGLCWTPVVRELEKDFDVIMYDARGHGRSEAPDTGYGTTNQAADLAALVQRLELDKPVIMGHSMGGATVGHAAATYPALFSKVVLEDPAWWEGDSPRRTMSDEERDAHITARREQIIAQNKMSRQALMDHCRRQSPSWAEEELGPWALSKQQLSPKVVQRLADWGKPWDEVAKAIEAPALLITAEADRGAIVTPELAAKVPEVNPLIEVVKIEDAGHNVRRENFDAYIAAVKAFLEQ